jgi:hypothetical protein
MSLSPIHWPHLIVNNFLTKAVLAQSLLQINADTYAYDIESRGTGRIEFSLLKSEALWRAIYSKSTVSLLSSAFGRGLKLNKKNMLQLRRMNEDTPEFPLHNDFTSDYVQVDHCQIARNLPRPQKSGKSSVRTVR